MVCDKCGQVISNGAKFCFKCGAQIDMTAERPEPVQQANSAQPTYDVPVQGEQQSYGGQMPAQNMQQSYGGQMPAQNMQQSYGGQVQPQNIQQSYGGQMPVQNMQQSYGGQVQPQNIQQSYGGQMQLQNMQQSYGGQVQPQQMQKSYGGQMPVQNMQQSYGGQVQPQNTRQSYSLKQPYGAQQNASKPYGMQQSAYKKPRKKKTGLIVAIVIICLLSIVIGILTPGYLLPGQGKYTQKGAVKAYFQAIVKHDSEAYINVCYPRKFAERVEEKTGVSRAEYKKELEEMWDIYYDGVQDVKIISVEQIEEYDTEMVEERIKNTYGVGLKIKKAVEVKVKIEYTENGSTEEEEGPLTLYKVGFKWFVWDN